MGRIRSSKVSVKKRGGIWYTSYYASDGTYMDKSLGTKSNAQAMALVQEHKAATEARIRNGHDSGGTRRASTAEKQGGDIIAEMEAWDIARARTKSNRDRTLHAGSIAQIEYCWRNVRRHIKSVHQINRRGLKAFTELRKSDASRRTGGLPPSNKTIRQDLQVLKRALHEFEAQGRPVPLLRAGDWPTLEHKLNDRCHKIRSHNIQRSDILAQLEGFSGGRSAEEHRALFILHLLTGMRKDEIAEVLKRPYTVHRSDDHGGMTVINTERIAVGNEFPRQIPLTPDALAALRFLQSLPRIKDHTTAFRQAAKRAGLHHSAHLRDLRSTFITKCNDKATREGVGRYLAGHMPAAGDSHARYDGKSAPPAIRAVRAVAAYFGFDPGKPVECPGYEEELA